MLVAAILVALMQFLEGGLMAMNMKWSDAIQEVLKQSSEAMHYAAIADAIVAQRLREDVGASPPTTVNVTLNQSIRGDGKNSPFVRVSEGHYWLRDSLNNSTQRGAAAPGGDDDEASVGLINGYGMYWRRSEVGWTSTSPSVLGQLPSADTVVNFCNQIGVYLLHDGRSVTYVGRTTDQPLGIRLRQHTKDRLNGRWDRFSWFGIYPVMATGVLDLRHPGKFTVGNLIATMEALLIEGLEPPQNRRGGDDFRAIEFLQVSDPEIEKNRKLAIIDDLKQSI